MALLRRMSPALLVLLVILVARIPFLLIHPLQEDAYITLRSARHLAEAGDLSFNLHEHFPGTTSLLYPLLIALLDLVLRSFMIPGLQLVETLCVAAAAYLAARALSPPGAQQRLVWLLSGCWPMALLMSYIGMETALLLLALSGCIYALARAGHATLFAACLLLLPLLRPDAVAYALIFLAAMFLLDRPAAWRGAGALIAGILILLAGTRITTGSFLSATAHAKQIAYHPDHSAAAVLGRVRDLFLGQSFLLPVATTYLARFSPLLFVIVTAAFAWWMMRARTRRERILAGALALATVAVPMAYAVGGVIFAWYLYPANWIAATVTIAVGVRILAASRFRLAAGLAAGLVWIALAGVQWSKALTSATEDYHFRGDIGRYLGEISNGQGTVFLEPAGLIPYYSGLRTVDEVGLVSPRITSFMQRDPVAWWFDYVRAQQPDYIVERQSFEHYETFQKYTLTPAQQQWFNAHYVLIRRAHYVPAEYHPSPLLRRVFALSRMEDYLVYQRRDRARAGQ
jgi:hypothetical protein